MERSFTTALGPEEEEDLAQHLNECEVCRRLALACSQPAALQDDLHQAQRIWSETSVDVNVPVARLNNLLPDYEIIAEVGRGGMGIVYQARQVKLNRTVALKVLPALLGAVRSDAGSRFKREAELAAGLKHTNIISVYDFGEVDGTLYYTMELVEGRSLRDILREIEETGAIDVVVGEASGSGSKATGNRQRAVREGTRHLAPGTSENGKGEGVGPSAQCPMPSACRSPSPPRTRLGSSSNADKAYYRRVARWVAEVAEALHYAHEQGVIHRDVKPSNLLLADTGRLMISDFGLARATGAETATASRALLGTARYMSPEQVNDSGDGIDRRVDVYGMGATLYELLAFRPMFAGADDREVLDCVLNREPPPPRRFVRQVPRELETICLKAVEKDPAARYQTAEALRDDLERWLLGLPIHAKRPSLPTRVGKFVRRRRLTAGLSAALVLLLVVSGLLYGGYRASQRRAVTAESMAQTRELRLLSFEAETALYQGRKDAALAKVDEALAGQPEAAELQLLRARILQRMGLTDDAVQYLKDIVARDSNSWYAHYLLARAYTEHGDEERAAQHRAQVERLIPQTTEALFLQACAEADNERALELLDQAIELDPSRIEVVLRRATTYRELKRYDQMLVDAERAVSLRPNWGVPHEVRAEALNFLRRFKDAERAQCKAIEADPDVALYWSNRAYYRCMLRRYSQCIADATEAIRLDPQLGHGYMSRGSARFELGDFEGGLRDLDRFVELDSESGNCYYVRGRYLYEAGRFDEAIADFDELLRHQPDESAAYHERGAAFLSSGRFKRAIADFSRAIEHPSSHTTSQGSIPTIHYARGVAYFRLGRYRDAIADFTRAIELGHATVSTLAFRGMAYEVEGGFDEAVADYDQAYSEVAGGDRVYPLVWKHAALRRAGRAEAARETLASFQADAGDAKGTGVAFQNIILGLFASDSTTAEAVLAAAADDEQRCLAHYYLGLKALLGGDTHVARASFAKCVAVHRPDVVQETDFARAMLERLGEAGRPAEDAL